MRRKEKGREKAQHALAPYTRFPSFRQEGKTSLQAEGEKGGRKRKEERPSGPNHVPGGKKAKETIVGGACGPHVVKIRKKKKKKRGRRRKEKKIPAPETTSFLPIPAKIGTTARAKEKKRNRNFAVHHRPVLPWPHPSREKKNKKERQTRHSLCRPKKHEGKSGRELRARKKKRRKEKKRGVLLPCSPLGSDGQGGIAQGEGKKGGDRAGSCPANPAAEKGKKKGERKPNGARSTNKEERSARENRRRTRSPFSMD